LNAAFSGLHAGLVYEGEKRFSLVVRMEEKNRTDIEDVRNLRVPAKNGMLIPLDQLAKVDWEDSPIQIQREQTQRRILVAFNVRGKDVSISVDELSAEIHEKVSFPAFYSLRFGGQFKNLEHANQRLMFAVPLALLIILLLLYLTFQPIKDALMIF